MIQFGAYCCTITNKWRTEGINFEVYTKEPSECHRLCDQKY